MAARKYGIHGTVGPAPGFTWKEVDDGWGRLPKTDAKRKRIVYQARYLNGLRAYIAKIYNIRRRDVIIIVNSWYRSPGYNRKIGGALFSQHAQSRATDIVVFIKRPNKPVTRLNPAWVGKLADRAVMAFRNGGIGVYPPAKGNFTHLDHRPNGPARW